MLTVFAGRWRYHCSLTTLPRSAAVTRSFSQFLVMCLAAIFATKTETEIQRERENIPDATLSPPVMRVDKQCEGGVGKSRPTQCSSTLAKTSHTVHCSFSRSDGGHARGTNDHQWNVSLLDALGGLCGEDLGSHL